MEPTFEGGAPATAGPAPESPKAGAKPKSNNAKRMKKKRQDVKGEAADIVSAEDVNGTTVSTGTTTAAVTAPVVEAASTVSASGPIAVDNTASKITRFSRKIESLDAELKQCAQDPVKWKELAQDRADYAEHLALLQRGQPGTTATPAPVRNNMGDGKISTEADLLKYIIENRKGRPLAPHGPGMLAMVYNQKGAPDTVKGFGSELRGQEAAGRMLAEYSDKAFRLEQVGDVHAKEDFKLPVCVHGVGCGKSVLLCNGLALHRQHCRNEDLQEMLRAENHPLAIHITFNALTPFQHNHEQHVNLAVIRRILARCLRLKWCEAVRLPLSESLRVNDCLGAVAAYHRTVHGMKEDQKLFMYLGIDDINDMFPFSNWRANSDLSTMRNLVDAVKRLSISNGFVSTLLAGTHVADVIRSFAGTGIEPLQLPITRLSEDAIESMLRTDAGVSQEYLDNPAFQKLLRGIGPVMRPIGIAVSKLEYEYNSKSIDIAEEAVNDYLESKRMASLSDKEIHAVLGLVFTGRTVNPSDPIVPDSLMTLDTLQNTGTMFLFCSPCGHWHTVFMTRLVLESFLRYHWFDHGDPLIASAEKLLGYIDRPGPDSLEKFVARFHAMKKASLLEKFPSGFIPYKYLYSEDSIGSELRNQEMQLKPTTLPMDCPDVVMCLEKKHYPDTVEPKRVFNHLKNGGVVLNAKGAAADIMVSENFRDNSLVPWHEGVTVYAIRNAVDGNEKMTFNDIEVDRNKAIQVLSASKNHSKAAVTMVHFSNRELAEDVPKHRDWMPEWRRAIVIGRHNIEGVVGVLFGRMLTSKHFYANSGAIKPKSYSTFARAVPTTISRRDYGTANISWMRRLLR